MKNNPLLAPLRTLVLNSESAMTEHQLIQLLVAQGVIESDYAASSLSLFCTHFLIMNGLYQMQQAGYAEGFFLHVSPLKIFRETCIRSADKARALDGTFTSNSSLENPALRDYYLDWKNLDNATEEGVADLLDNFWKKYVASGVDDKAHEEALRVLGLDSDADYATIKQQYRRMAMACHPDRGGDQVTLQAINGAMDVLKKVYGR